MEKPEQMTDEKMKEMEAINTKFIEERLPFLRIQHEYETKMADVGEARVRQKASEMALAELTFKQQEARKAFEERQKESK